MTDNKAIKAAFDLQQNPEKIAPYYDGWATEYDRDVTSEKYHAPKRIAELALKLSDLTPESRVLDAGCGTGLIGVALRAAGFDAQLTGIDLSHDMVEQARNTDCYSHLFGAVDLNIAIDSQIHQGAFDLCVCGGVFTLGHVPPTALDQLIDATRTKGLVVFSARKEFCDKRNFEAFIQKRVDQGRVEVVHMEYNEYMSYDQAMYAGLTVL